MPKKTYSASCQVYRYFNVETGECISAYYAKTLPPGKVKIEVLHLAVKSKSPMEMRRSMSLPLRMQSAMRHKLHGLFIRSMHIILLLTKQKEVIFQQVAKMFQKVVRLSIKHYTVSKRLLTRSHAAPLAISKKAVKKNPSLVAEIP